VLVLQTSLMIEICAMASNDVCTRHNVASIRQRHTNLYWKKRGGKNQEEEKERQKNTAIM
jgi:hypothetical protein